VLNVLVATALSLFQNIPALASSKLKLPTPSLITQGIDPAFIKSAVFIKFNAVPKSMTIDEDETDKINLSSVRFFGGHRTGIWLKTVCSGRSREFVLEECRGTACIPTTQTNITQAQGNKITFQGEFGQYVLTRNEFAKQIKSGIPAGSGLCKRSWPAWATSARAQSHLSNLSFPQNLLILQTDQRIYLVDAINQRVWNQIAWSSAAGLFNQISSTDDGQILLKNNSHQALFLNFNLGVFFALNGGMISTSFEGLNALFSTNPLKSTEIVLNLGPQDGGDSSQPTINLGGLWWASGYLNWTDVTLATRTQKAPPLRIYPNNLRHVSTLWSDESGEGKTHILLRSAQKLELYSQSSDSKDLMKSRSFVPAEDDSETTHHFVHPNFLTKIKNDGHIIINSGDKTSRDQKVIAQPAVLQSGYDLLTLVKHQGLNDRCRAVYFTPRKNLDGWVENLALGNVPCGTGIGRGSAGAAIVELTPSHVNIHLIESSQ